MKPKAFFFVSLLISFSMIAKAGIVDTVSIESSLMQHSSRCVVVLPDSYRKNKQRYPVVYLLHGYSGNYSNWIKKIPELKNYADQYQVICICPDGGFSSWYFDSPVDSSSQYESYISKDVLQYVDSHYRSIADKAHRAITGLSMGGHGALFLALRHPDLFGAAASMSGGVDLSESRNRFDVMKRIGDTTIHAKEWHDLTVINLVENYVNTPVKILFDCGNKDIFVEGNRRLHQKMLQLHIPHDYIERPGEHNWAYWSNSLPYQLLFFRRFFDSEVRH